MEYISSFRAIQTKGVIKWDLQAQLLFSNPLDNSLWLLTSLELWMAIGRVATSILPLLGAPPARWVEVSSRNRTCSFGSFITRRCCNFWHNSKTLYIPRSATEYNNDDEKMPRRLLGRDRLDIEEDLVFLWTQRYLHNY